MTVRWRMARCQSEKKIFKTWDHKHLVVTKKTVNLDTKKGSEDQWEEAEEAAMEASKIMTLWTPTSEEEEVAASSCLKWQANTDRICRISSVKLGKPFIPRIQWFHLPWTLTDKDSDALESMDNTQGVQVSILQIKAAWTKAQAHQWKEISTRFASSRWQFATSLKKLTISTSFMSTFRSKHL